MRQLALGVASLSGLLALSACELNTGPRPAAAPSSVVVAPAPQQPSTVVVQPRPY